jgi:hypothetical protein
MKPRLKVKYEKEILPKLLKLASLKNFAKNERRIEPPETTLNMIVFI